MFFLHISIGQNYSRILSPTLDIFEVSKAMI
jgi:hypothetical protein